METDPIICRWAEQKYDVEGVKGVDFETEYDYGYSEYTSGMGEYIAVTLYGENKKVIRGADEFDACELIIDVCRFAAKQP